MTARKKSARKVAAKKSATASLLEPRKPTNPRVEAWRAILIAKAKGEVVPREHRVNDTSRFTGRDAVAQVQAGPMFGVAIEDAVDVVLKSRLEAHRGDKDCDW